MAFSAKSLIEHKHKQVCVYSQGVTAKQLVTHTLVGVHCYVFSLQPQLMLSACRNKLSC